MELRLIVLRTANIKLLSAFYANLGLTFSYHKHGNSPFHYSTSIGNTVVEIYPLNKTQIKADDNLRLGFSLDDFDSVINKLTAADTIFKMQPAPTEWGYMAIIEDPDGRKVELYKE
jgi:lactoylglutathione lyase